MYLMYVDESGDTGLVNSPTRYFVLSGMVVHESDWRQLLQALIAFRRTMKAVYGLPMRDEIHAAPFIRGKVRNIARHDRLAILRNCIDELAKFPYVSLTNVLIDKQGKQPGYDVFGNAWKLLFQRFENTLKYGNFPKGCHQDHGLVVTDATSGNKLTRLVRRMAVHNPIPNDGGLGYRNIPILRVIEDPHGKDSAESLPVQMVDVAAYFLLQRYAPNGYIKRQKANRYFDRLLPVLNVRASRFDALGVVRL